MRWSLSVGALSVPVVGLLIAAALGACGSSSNGGGPGPADGGKIIVNPHPTIVSMTPANGDDNVSVHDPITVTFSEPVKLGANPLTLVGPGSAAIGVHVIQSNNGTTVTIQPAQDLIAPTKLSVTWGDIASAATGEGAEQLPWSWSLPLWLRIGGAIANSGSEGTFNGSTLALDTNDHLYYADNDNGQGVNVSSIDNYHGTWKRLGTSIRKDPDAGVGDSSEPGLTIDKDGNAVVAFVTASSDNRVVRWTGTNWEDLGGVLGTYQIQAPIFVGPSIALDPTNAQLALLYAASDSSAHAHLYVRSFVNGSWSAPGAPVADGTFQGIAISKKTGTRYIVYENGSSNTYNMYVEKSVANSWSQVGGAINDGLVTWPRLVLDDQERPIVAGCSGNDNRVRRLNGGNWTVIEDNSQVGCTSSLIAAGQQGHVFSFWTDGNSSPKIADISDSGVAAINLPAMSNKVTSRGIVVDSHGNPIVGWVEPDNTFHAALLNR